MKYLLIVVSLLSINCTTYSNKINDQGSKLVHLDRYLSFEITKKFQEFDSEREFWIILHLKNITTKEIYIDKPICFGTNIFPFLNDSDGKSLQMQFRIRANCEGEIQKVLPSETYEESFLYDLHKCFDFTKQGTYYLKFDYSGIIYDANRKRLTLDNQLTSNVLEIITN